MAIMRASEVGEYVYCARAWWLRRVVGLQPAGRERRLQGTRRHARHARTVQASQVVLRLALLLLLAAVGALIWELAR